SRRSGVDRTNMRTVAAGPVRSLAARMRNALSLISACPSPTGPLSHLSFVQEGQMSPPRSGCYRAGPPHHEFPCRGVEFGVDETIDGPSAETHLAAES